MRNEPRLFVRVLRATRGLQCRNYMPSKPACRLFVIPAAEAPVAVVVRRGPSAWVQIIRWNTERDTFEDGAWIRGRVYAEKCDLSPEGSLFVYFVARNRRHEAEAGYGCAWTAVSRPPWLTALALWPADTTYGVGGRFLSDGSLVLRTEAGAFHPNFPPPPWLHFSAGGSDYHQSSGEIERAEWSGRDQRDRIIFTRGGKLFRRARIRGRVVDKELADFNGRAPDPQRAPESAQRKTYRLPRK
jgi:hypothetical protein